jgi:serine phosphatase RsbU (regulator of sigma subunit)
MPAVRTLEYAGACLQAREVGGDYYDFLALGQERLVLVIGDIAGRESRVLC